MRPLVLACGALASDLRVCLPEAVDVEYLPANLHNRPEGIVPALRPRLVAARQEGRPVFVAYADCGTGGALDALLDEFQGVTRLPGAHCYEMFAGGELFAALHAEEPGTFFLTDFLARHFDALVWHGLGLQRHPQLRDTYFANYQRVVHLAQTSEMRVLEAARAAAARLDLPLEVRIVGRDRLRSALVEVVGATA